MCPAGVATPARRPWLFGTGEAGVEQRLGIWFCFVLNPSGVAAETCLDPEQGYRGPS